MNHIQPQGRGDTRTPTQTERNDSIQSSISDSKGSQTEGQAATIPPYSFELHIEELVLEGLAPNDHYLIGETLGRELERLLSRQTHPPLLAHDIEIAQLDGGAFEMPAGASSKIIGIHLAQAINGVLRK